MAAAGNAGIEGNGSGNAGGRSDSPRSWSADIGLVSAAAVDGGCASTDDPCQAHAAQRSSGAAIAHPRK